MKALIQLDAEPITDVVVGDKVRLLDNTYKSDIEWYLVPGSTGVVKWVQGKLAGVIMDGDSERFDWSFYRNEFEVLDDE